MKRVLSVMCLMVVSACVQAQQPYTVTRVYGSVFPGWTDVFSYDIEGTLSSMTLGFPDFQGFNSIEFDRSRDRVVLIALETGAARFVSVDPSLDPASVVTLRTGIDVDAVGVNVHPDTGRIYWWENDTILSVDADGSGAAVIEADNVPEPEELVIDFEHDQYTLISFSDLLVGLLAGVSSPAPTEIPMQLSSSADPIAIAVEPFSGDIYWSEYLFPSGFTGDACAVYQIPYDNLNGTPQLVLGSEVPTLSPTATFSGIAVIRDQLIATSSLSLSSEPAPELTLKNLTTNTVTSVPVVSPLNALSIDYDVAPILVHPIGAVVDQGDSYVLEVVPTDELASFQWQRNGEEIEDATRVFGATTNKLVIQEAMLSDTDTYTCMVTSTDGEQQRSDEAIFAVRGSQEPMCDADLNGDGELNFFDVSVFLSLYNAGCP